jgi:hypothetical protein
MKNCKQDCNSCGYWWNNRCCESLAEFILEPKKVKLRVRDVNSAMRWLQSDWDGRAEGSRSPELMTNLIDLPNPFDRMLEESTDWYVQVSEEEGSGPSQLSRVIKRRELERQNHPLSDLELPDDDEVVEDEGFIPLDTDGVPMSSSCIGYEIDADEDEDDELIPRADDPGAISLPKSAWDYVFGLKWVKAKGGGMVRVEDSSNLYPWPKIRNFGTRNAKDVMSLENWLLDGIVSALRCGLIITPRDMAQAMNRLKATLSNAEHYQRKKHGKFTRAMIKRCKVRVEENPSYQPERVFFLYTRRLWDFFHRVYQVRDSNGYQAWIARLIERKKKNKMKKQSGPCARCNGTGKIAAYAHVNNGLCFECGGMGNTTKSVVQTKEVGA